MIAKETAQQLAINFGLVAYQHGIRREVIRDQILRVADIASTSYVFDANHKAIVPNVQPSAAELEHKDGPFVLWVGMMLPGAEQHQSKEAKTPKRPKRKRDEEGDASRSGAQQIYSELDSQPPGTSAIRAKKLHTLLHSTVALRAVVQLSEANINYGVLVQPIEGLCTFQWIEEDSIFFFPEFRNDYEAAIEARRANCSRLIRTKIGIISLIDRKFVEHEQDKPKEVGVLPSVELTIDSDNHTPVKEEADDVTAMGGPSEIAKGREDGDPPSQPHVANVALYRCLSIWQPFHKEHAQKAIQEIETTWPALKEDHLTPHDISRLATGLRQGKITIEHRSLRCFLVNWKLQHTGEENGEELGKLVEAVRAISLRMVGTESARSTHVEGGDMTESVEAIQISLKGLTTRVQLHADALREFQGSSALELSVRSIWERFEGSSDHESAIQVDNALRAFDVSRITLDDFSLNTVVDQLESVRLNLRGLTNEQDNGMDVDECELRDT